MSSAGSHLHTASVSSKTLRCSKIASAASVAVQLPDAGNKAALTGELRHDAGHIYLCVKGGAAGLDVVHTTATSAAASGQRDIVITAPASADVPVEGDVVTGDPGLVPFCTVTGWNETSNTVTVSADITTEIAIGAQLMLSKPGKSIWKRIATS